MIDRSSLPTYTLLSSIKTVLNRCMTDMNHDDYTMAWLRMRDDISPIMTILQNRVDKEKKYIKDFYRIVHTYQDVMYDLIVTVRKNSTKYPLAHKELNK